MLIETRLPPFEGVAPGQQALIKLPIGRRYHHLFLVYAGVTLAQMTEIRILANGKVFQRFSATERDKMNQFLRIAAADGILQIPFDRIGLLQRENRELTAVNTGVADQAGFAINSFTVEVDISGAATAPVLSMFATQGDPLPGGPGAMLNIRKESRSISGAGELEVSDYVYNKPVAQSLNCAYFVPSAGTINRIKVERNLYAVWDRTTALNTKVQLDNVRTPVDGWWVLDTCERGYGGNNIGLKGVTDFRLAFECSAAMNITSLMEYIGVLGQ